MTPKRIPSLPARLDGLAVLATNLWWSWSRDARALFRTMDELVWRETLHNPVELLRRMDPERITDLTEDPAFLARFDRVRGELQDAVSRSGSWYAKTFPELADQPIAYFCAEFGLHNSVPIYSGGLGILAGDHCKTASDLGVPLVGVGLMYTRGYFDQRVKQDGWQEDADEELDPSLTPLVPLLDPKGDPALITVKTFGRNLHVGAWRLMVGSIPIYLLDTDLERNHPDDRGLTHRLYAGGETMRLRQEWILGVAGVRLIRWLGLSPAAWHANEGHAAFMLVERVRELTSTGVSWDEAVARVAATSLFTTHTPVPAGHDQFNDGDVLACMGDVWDPQGVDPRRVLELGRHPTAPGERFHMTAAAIRLSHFVNGVSRVHGDVSRRMWAPLWPERAEADVPIGHVTNGVHLATWMANPVMDLLDRHLGQHWGTERDDPSTWEGILSIDDAELWAVHLELKANLLGFVREEARRRWRDRWKEPTSLASAGTLLDPDALTIGFARRFATYKRADLLFRDKDRLRAILSKHRRPVQLVFAGKAHPADHSGKEILKRVFQAASDPWFEGRITFLEDYEMHLAHRLVQGVDLWLNLPRVPLEACGTSGMKAALNGVPQLGTLDGWWAEGFTGENGWAIPPAPTDDADAHDAEQLFVQLETEVVPAFYTRSAHGVPTRWVHRMKHALYEACRRFTGRAMLQQYVKQYYVPATRASQRGAPASSGTTV